jgi:hypothetical protein
MHIVRGNSPAQQPQRVARINWDNPITSRMVYAFNAGFPSDLPPNLVTGATAYYSNNVAPTFIRTKRGLGIGGATWERYVRLPYDVVYPYSRYTLVQMGGDGLGFYMGDATGGKPHNAWSLSGTTLRAYVPDKYINFTAASAAGELNSVGIRVAGAGIGSAVDLYRDGKADVSSTTDNLVGAPQDFVMKLGHWYYNQSAVCDFVWYRPLSDAEFMSLHNDPWQLFLPAHVRKWFSAPAAAAGFKPAWVRRSSPVIGAGVR